MVLKADGSKYACQSCLKGHRVSACTHVDRELIFVPKKGRPVTQCQHCRQERKKRSAHVKCDCGETERPHHSKEKCIHLREAEERAKAGFYDEPVQNAPVEHDAAHLVAVAEEQGCCCHHGGKCSCSLLKKEPTNSDGTAPHGPAVKPRLEKTSSDSSITVFSNGHHKPVHRKNHAAHECGMPYKMPLPRSHTEQSVSTSGVRHSIDDLALENQSFQLPVTSAAFGATQQGSATEAGISSTDSSRQQMARGSLTEIPINGFASLSHTSTNQSVQSSVSETMSFPAFDPITAATDGPFDPWSAFPSSESLTIGDNPFGTWAFTNDGFTMDQPALTAGSSGTQSEIDEIPPSEDIYSFAMPSIQEDMGSISATTNGPASPQSNRRSLPASFFGNLDFTMAGTGNNWAAANNNTTTNGNDDSKPHAPNNLNFSQYDDTWQMANMNLSAGVPQRQVGGVLNTGRPTSQSVGPSNAPGDDIIRQLFPDIDVDGSIFGSGVTGSPQEIRPSSNEKTTSASMVTSAPLSATQLSSMMNESTGMTPPSWTDGSMAMPNDAYSPSTYDLDQDFSGPDLSGNWSQ